MANGWGVAVASEKVVGLGLCVIDHVYVVERLDFAETRIRFTQRLVLPGGMIGTAVSQAATLGCEAHLLSMLGDDADGRFVRRSIEEIGVKTERLVISPDAETTVAVVLVEQNSGERRFIVPDRRALERDAPDFDLTAIDSTTTVLVDGHFPEQALRAVEKAREVGASVVGDFHRPRPAVRKLLPYVDFPVVPLEFAELISAGDPQRAMFEMADQFGGTPVVTLGAEGGLYLEEGRVRRFAAQPVAVVDTTGAGDLWAAGFLYGIVNGFGLEKSGQLGSACGYEVCQVVGAGIPAEGWERIRSLF